MKDIEDRDVTVCHQCGVLVHIDFIGKHVEQAHPSDTVQRPPFVIGKHDTITTVPQYALKYIETETDIEFVKYDDLPSVQAAYVEALENDYSPEEVAVVVRRRTVIESGWETFEKESSNG